MRTLQLICMLFAAVSASPTTFSSRTPNLPKARRTENLRRTTYLANETLAACAAASNCETYEDPIFGTRIRFVAGMGPGSEHYKREVLPKLNRRDDSGVVTHVTVGSGTINYGSAKASGAYGVIHHLYDICHDAMCDTNEYSVASEYADASRSWEGNVILHASGSYNGWDARNAFLDAIVAIAAQGEDCKTQDWINGGDGSWVWQGTVEMCTQTNYIGVNRFASDSGAMLGFVEVRAEQEDQGSDWCPTLLGALGGITGIIGALPGLEASGGLSGFFGVLSVFCP